MNNLQIFNNNEFGEIRTIVGQDGVWFIGVDIANALGYSNSSKAVTTHTDEEDRKLEMIPHSQNGKMVRTQTNIINESGLYSLILGSKLPNAKKFKRWVTSEVLPSIRNNGGYMANQENMTPEEIVANALIVAQNIIKEKDLQLQQANQVIEMQKPQVQAWEQLMDSKSNMTMGQVAKAFDIEGMGRNNLLKLLRDKKVLRLNNEPYQSQVDVGRFTTILTEKNGYTYSVTVMTPKGLKWLAGQLVEWGYIS